MQYIAHRINTVELLQKIPEEYGVELDLRDSGSRLILAHDPFSGGEDFEEYCGHYRHGTMICNIKSERIEEKVQAVLAAHHIDDYFFLDSSFPMMFRLSRFGERRFAVRFSEFEGIDTVLALKRQVDWVWVDCFTHLPINAASGQAMRQAGFKLCLVSPDLQGRPEDIEKYRHRLAEDNIVFDAVCAKYHNIPFWQG
jgi:hypothetical protein